MFCKTHQKEFSVYCENDKLLLCVDCIINSKKHKNHKLKNMRSAEKKLRLNLKKIKLQIKKLEKKSQKAIKNSNNTLLSFKHFENQISEKTNFFKISLLDFINKSINEFQKKFIVKLNDLKKSCLEVSKPFENKNKELENLNNYAKFLDETKNPVDFIYNLIYGKPFSDLDKIKSDLNKLKIPSKNSILIKENNSYQIQFKEMVEKIATFMKTKIILKSRSNKNFEEKAKSIENFDKNNYYLSEDIGSSIDIEIESLEENKGEYENKNELEIEYEGEQNNFEIENQKIEIKINFDSENNENGFDCGNRIDKDFEKQFKNGNNYDQNFGDKFKNIKNDFGSEFKNEEEYNKIFNNKFEGDNNNFENQFQNKNKYKNDFDNKFKNKINKDFENLNFENEKKNLDFKLEDDKNLEIIEEIKNSSKLGNMKEMSKLELLGIEDDDDEIYFGKRQSQVIFSKRETVEVEKINDKEEINNFFSIDFQKKKNDEGNEKNKKEIFRKNSKNFDSLSNINHISPKDSRKNFYANKTLQNLIDNTNYESSILNESLLEKSDFEIQNSELIMKTPRENPERLTQTMKNFTENKKKIYLSKFSPYLDDNKKFDNPLNKIKKNSVYTNPRIENDRSRRKTEIFKFQKKFNMKKSKNRSTSINENLKNKSFLKTTNSFMRKCKNNANMINNTKISIPKINDFYLITGGTSESSLKFQFLKKRNFELHFTKKCMKLKNVKNHGTMCINNKIFVVGGKQRKNINGKIMEFDYTKEKFKECSFCLIKPKYDFAFVKIGKWKMMIFGGKDKKGNPLTEIEIIDFKIGTSKTVGHLKNPRYAFSAILKPKNSSQERPEKPEQINIFKQSQKKSRYDNKVHNIYSSYKPKISIEKEKNFSNTFRKNITTKNSINSFYSNDQRNKSPTRKQEENHLIYLIGGKMNKNNFYNTIDIFSIKKMKIIDNLKMECSKSRSCISNKDEKIFIFGGKNDRENLKNIGVIENGNYKMIAFMSKERSHFSGVWKGEEFVYFGGKCGNKIVKDWEVFDGESFETRVFHDPIGKRLYNFNIVSFNTKT